MNLAPLTQRFVLHFGEMGSRWGINRTVGQIYALLYVSPRALNADDIGEALAFSRSNVSMGLKELQSWNLVRLQHLPNDRREYFQAPDDVWAIFRTLAEERRKREIDPTLSMLRDALMETPSVGDEIHAQARMRQMHDLIELMTGWLADVQKMDSATLVSLMKMGAKELQSWNLVRLQHLPNDRREYFQAPDDVWAIFRTLAEERRKREIDPTLSMLRDALMETPAAGDDIHAQARMRQMHDLIELMTGWLADVQKMDSATLVSLMKMGAKVQKLLEVKSKISNTVKSGLGGRRAKLLTPAQTFGVQNERLSDTASPAPEGDDTGKGL